MTAPDDPLDDLARELRASTGDEFALEAEAGEREAQQGRLRARTTADVLTEAMHRGDRVRARVAGLVVTGTVA
ncbi:MAG: hypothetical protein GWN79_28640, partial [Actinobacteria bacterium]|nr:hypothetical protein [Actinomycetota bacterium]NIS37235.1 hypothetical protein [Actinomycetota bacterium]NIT99154.1 hypothetical protein [Actinomycetota bacterium]NIU22764.1 hypothetical protein [Actinomycetota bacterium]NIU71666.1 hypothetical protein [Actinomycetota bacterium]